MGADAIGFMFAPSPRQVTASAVADIVKRLPNDVLTIGVFRDEAPERVVETIHRGRPARRSVARSRNPRSHVVGRRTDPVCHQGLRGRRSRRIATRAVTAPSAILLDAPSPGSGEVFDWRLADGVPDRQPADRGGRARPRQRRRRDRRAPTRGASTSPPVSRSHLDARTRASCGRSSRTRRPRLRRRGRTSPTASHDELYDWAEDDT